MRSDASDCVKLIETTANALDDDTLKLLFVSVQQNSINLYTLRHRREVSDILNVPDSFLIY